MGGGGGGNPDSIFLLVFILLSGCNLLIIFSEQIVNRMQVVCADMPEETLSKIDPYLLATFQ